MAIKAMVPNDGRRTPRPQAKDCPPTDRGLGQNKINEEGAGGAGARTSVASRLFQSFREKGEEPGGRGRDESKRKGLNLNESWQQNHSVTYNTPSQIEVVCKGFCSLLDGNCTSKWPMRLVSHNGLANDTCPWGPEGPYCGSASEWRAYVSLLAPDSDLEAFSHNPR
ncbi:UNVERIFIED_CONTAM: hypothetical protein Sindi_2117800 [Sesamum indicum]